MMGLTPRPPSARLVHISSHLHLADIANTAAYSPRLSLIADYFVPSAMVSREKKSPPVSDPNPGASVSHYGKAHWP